MLESNLLGVIIVIAAYVVPIYIANASPILIHGKKPLDFGKKYKGKRIFGNGKSILGFLAGIICGSLAGIAIGLVFPEFILFFGTSYFVLVFLLAFGAMLGDVIESFFKRRLGKERGEKWLFFDQLDFVVGALILSLFIRLPELWFVVLVLVATVFIHLITNFIAFKLGLKKVPW
jgi:CDP-2,3-bis-(O-geranylgeranyl)-sn-glycerol synthase